MILFLSAIAIVLAVCLYVAVTASLVRPRSVISDTDNADDENRFPRDELHAYELCDLSRTPISNIWGA